MGWDESEIGKKDTRERKREFAILQMSPFCFFFSLGEMNKLPAIFEVNPDSRHQNDLVMMCLQRVGESHQREDILSVLLTHTKTNKTNCVEFD